MHLSSKLVRIESLTLFVCLYQSFCQTFLGRLMFCDLLLVGMIALSVLSKLVDIYGGPQ